MKRGSGILLHITALPSPYGIGDLGTEAYRFADRLRELGQQYWQVLPLNPTETFCGNSPYSSPSAFAGNPLLISPEILARDGFLDREDTDFSLPQGRVDYEKAVDVKTRLLEKACAVFRTRRPARAGFEAFCRKHAAWLDDHALFTALSRRFKNKGLGEWPEPVHRRVPEELESWRRELADEIEQEQFNQYMFFTQWEALKAHANKQGVQIVGDAPIYVSGSSADVWAHPGIFKLDKNLRQTASAGVPPDYFSKTGQLWGNPVYNWAALRKTKFAWWIGRLQHAFSLFDRVRIDHFRGFAGYWEVPPAEKTAVNGRWVAAPGRELFETLRRKRPDLPVIAEDLGVITPDVRKLIRHFQFPGIRVLLFAFNGDSAENPYIPHNLDRHCVLYTGTHDNNTARGWFEQDATPDEKRALSGYLGKTVTAGTVAEDLVRLAMMSVADVAMLPLQDVLGLGQEARMNFPSTARGNWEWRAAPGYLENPGLALLADMTRAYSRGTSPA